VADGLAAALIERIHRHGPLPFDAYVDAVLYAADGGFYGSGRGAGRQGADFITSPEVGGLYGVLVARQLDRWWDELGRPDPFVVVEAGAGRGVLARDVLRAEPACAPALRYVLVERSAALAARQHEVVPLEPAAQELGALAPADDAGRDPDDERSLLAGIGPRCCALDRLPALAVDGVIFANELLDNLAFRVVAKTVAGWDEVRVGVDDAGTLVEVVVPAAGELVARVDGLVAGLDVPVGARLPVQAEAAAWVAQACASLRRGWVACVDYAATVPELVQREAVDPQGWLRTYGGHRRGTDVLAAPGGHDVTVDVVVDVFERAARRAGATPLPVRTQAEWLADLGVDELAAEAEARWLERAHVGDLAALVSRSRVSEAAALTDPGGLGAHRLLLARIHP
jgi:SAM-dependent MidA family methyltransferase